MDSPEEQAGGAAPPVSPTSLEKPAEPTGTNPGEVALTVPAAAGGRRPPPPPPPSGGEPGDEEEGMLRMSFLEHLEELRSRIFKCLIGAAVAFVVSLTLASPLWTFLSGPAVGALKTPG